MHRSMTTRASPGVQALTPTTHCDTYCCWQASCDARAMLRHGAYLLSRMTVVGCHLRLNKGSDSAKVPRGELASPKAHPPATVVHTAFHLMSRQSETTTTKHWIAADPLQPNLLTCGPDALYCCCTACTSRVLRSATTAGCSYHCTLFLVLTTPTAESKRLSSYLLQSLVPFTSCLHQLL